MPRMRCRAVILRTIASLTAAAIASARSASSSRIQLQDQDKPAPKSIKLGPQQGQQRASVAGTQLGHVARPRTQGRPRPDALSEQQRLDSVLDTQLLLDEVLALAVRALGVLLIRRGHAYHAAHLPVATQPGGEH